MRRPLAAAMLLFAFLAALYAQTARVAVDKASLRGRPADDAKVVETLARDSEVEVIKVSGLWYLVQSTDYTGWMFIKDLDVKRSTAPPVQAAKTTADPLQPPPAGTVPRSIPDAKGRTYIRGPRGGCYYIGPSGSKVYVAHELCS